MGTPLPDVHVRAVGRAFATMDAPYAMTDAAGRFEIGNLGPGTYELDAHGADGADAVLPEVQAGAAAVTVRLARAGAIDGTLAGFAAPPAEIVTSVVPDVRLARATADGDRFSRVGLRQGRYLVDAAAGVVTVTLGK